MPAKYANERERRNQEMPAKYANERERRNQECPRNTRMNAKGGIRNARETRE